MHDSISNVIEASRRMKQNSEKGTRRRKTEILLFRRTDTVPVCFFQLFIAMVLV